MEGILPTLLEVMYGKEPTLRDYVLTLQPEPRSLTCDEQLDSSDSEDEREQPTQQDQQVDLQVYKVVTECTSCYCSIRLVVKSSSSDIKKLEELLLGTLQIVCPLCTTAV